MRTALLTNVAALGPGGSGPGPPSWVASLRAPSGDLPTIIYDFKNGQYWGGGAVVTLADVAEENLDWGPWNPATSIVPGSGYIISQNNTWITVPDPIAAPLLTTGMTALIIVDSIDTQPYGGTNAGWSVNYWESTFSNIPGVGCQTRFDGANYPSAMFSFTQSTGTQCATVDLTGTVGMAATIPVDTSINCAAVVPGTSVTTDAGFVGVPPITNIGLNPFPFTVAGVYCALIAVYPPQPDADLPAICNLR